MFLGIQYEHGQILVTDYLRLIASAVRLRTGGVVGTNESFKVHARAFVACLQRNAAFRIKNVLSKTIKKERCVWK